MADAFLALADLVKINSMDVADIEVSDLLNQAPLMAALAAETASNGTTHKYVKETGAPVVGFRAINAGLENKASADTSVSIDLKVLDSSFSVDVALANGYRKGWAAYVAREALRHLRACFFEAENQFINGTGNDADGFTGLANALAFGGVNVLNATGSTANTASSVYLIRTVGDGTGVTAIAGQDGNIEIAETTVIQKVVNPGTDNKTYPAYYTPVTGWLGLQIGGVNDVGRIVNLTAQAGKGLTDNLIYEALSMFPASKMPTHLVMGRRSLKQLRESRTATNAKGAPAPFPTEVDGIPIIVTDAIGATEAILS